MRRCAANAQFQSPQLETRFGNTACCRPWRARGSPWSCPKPQVASARAAAACRRRGQRRAAALATSMNDGARTSCSGSECVANLNRARDEEASEAIVWLIVRTIRVAVGPFIPEADFLVLGADE